ncbi:UNVERIFIED_CONTAM: Origin recognition complex subunit 5 [Gekko kuhli]
MWVDLATGEPGHRSLTHLVLDNAEQLREMEANILPGFLRLNELTDQNVTVILLSDIVWELLRPNTGCLEPMPLYFPDYSIDPGHKQLGAPIMASCGFPEAASWDTVRMLDKMDIRLF